MMVFALRVVAIILLAFVCVDVGHGEEGEMYSRIYVGTYTGEGPTDSKGIYVIDFDAESGRFGEARLAGEATNPSFLAISNDGSRLYSVTETRTAAGRSGAAIICWNITSDGSLVELGRAPAGGDGPCHVSLDTSGRFAGVANYGGGSASLYRLDSKGIPTLLDTVQHAGKSVNEQRQGEPHAHAFQFSSSGDRCYVTDLGTDELVVYDIVNDKLARNQRLTYKVTPGHGPRHFAQSSDGNYIFVIEELSSKLTVLRLSDDGYSLTDEQSTLPSGFSGNNSTAEVLVHPNGEIVYGSNRGHDSLAVFRFDDAAGKLQPLGHVSTGGRTPRNFRISPDGRWIIAANQETNNLVVFEIDAKGLPVANGEQIQVGKPVCVKFAK